MSRALGSSTQRSQSVLEKWLIPGLKYRVELEISFHFREQGSPGCQSKREETAIS